MTKAAWVLIVSTSLGAWGDLGYFQSAKPVWPTGREKEKNLLVGFRAVVSKPEHGRAQLRLTASTIYRCFINGEFMGYGPARGPHGFYRVDEWDITDRLQAGENVVAVEAAGYNANSYYLLDQPSFVQAEVVADGGVLASTGGSGTPFEARILPERVQKVQRYSFQRPFGEVYRLSADYDRWRTAGAALAAPLACSEQSVKALLPRRVAYPSFELRQPVFDVASGTVEPAAPDQLWRDRSLTGIGPNLGGYLEQDLDAIPSLDLQKVKTASRESIQRPLEAPLTATLTPNTYHIVDFGTNLTGFIGAHITARTATRLYLTFDEMLREEDVDFKRLGCVNAVTLDLPAGSSVRFESIEPYTLRYLKLMVLEGDCSVGDITLREYVNPDVWGAQFACSNPVMNQLFSAGRETFRQNAVDVFTDCPSRERAGWLCDSFFTARVACDLAGNTRLEHNFFENFQLPPKFDHLPDGMLPMCYPSDHNDGVFIPNWALWFVVQLDEYAARSGDRATVDALKPKVLALFDYFKRFKNEDGLLEKLESWVFVEWSKANEFVQDVNYPTNMLYAAALASTAHLYNLPELQVEADGIRNVIRRQSYDGTFFVDNAVRKEGTLEVTRNRSEVCQYFAFFFDVANPETHAELWQTLCEQFGPDRKDTRAFPEIWPANSFVGNMLRFEVLSRYGKSAQILQESVGYLQYMADRTGTLWENNDPNASLNHGFASHIVHTLYRDVLGIYRVDSVNKTVRLRFSDLDLDWCEGRRPVPEGAVAVRWWKKDQSIHYRVDVPAGYRVMVEKPTDCEIVREP